MSLDLKMPALSPTMETGTLARWLVAVGDTVKPGDLLAEIETDKATMEFESADEGRIAELLVAAGAEDVAVGTVIARLSTDADEAKGASASASRQPEPVAEAPAPIASAAKALPPSTPPPPASVPAPPANADRANASPLARRLAQVLGVDLDPISGSGPNGRILKQDVLPAPTPRTATVAAAPVAPIQIRQDEAPAAAVPDIPHQVIALSSMRKTIVRRLTASKQQVPHIYLTVELELDPLLALRTSLNDALTHRGVKLSINDMLIKAQAAALMAVPSCNVMLSGDQLVRFSRADIAVAVSIDGGLITPIIKGADSKSLSAITVEMKALAQSARDGRLTPDQYQGGTASLSNMGMYGIKQFAAVINPPQGMILAIGASSRQPIVRGDQIDIGTLMSVTGSFDHRVVDGADAAAFLAAFKTVVENPLSSLA